MEYVPNAHPMQVGLFKLDGTESIDEIKAKVLAERERVNPGSPYNGKFYDHPAVKPYKQRTKFKGPRAGKNELSHDKRTTAAIAACEKAGAEFWAFAGPRRVWGVKDGEYIEVAI
ncbi:hypothetical protein ACFU44_00785 [Nocardia rhizosphaerihabitans]|uniref:hypothetical protein n=1 Tax=Nocardia rhizosphaerihabitans TaxID=1691570 RepID=UPI0036715596